MMGFWIVGTRVVFALPLDLRANWVFRAAPLDGERGILAARRRALLAISVLPAWIVAACIFLWMWPWRPAAIHLAALGLFGIALAEILPARSAEDPVRVLVPAGKIECQHDVLAVPSTRFSSGSRSSREWEQDALESPVKTVKMLDHAGGDRGIRAVADLAEHVAGGGGAAIRGSDGRRHTAIGDRGRRRPSCEARGGYIVLSGC